MVHHVRTLDPSDDREIETSGDSNTVDMTSRLNQSIEIKCDSNVLCDACGLAAAR